MSKLDPQWAINGIDQFLHVTEQVVPDMGPAIAYFGTVTPGQETEASARAHVVEQILDRVLPGWRSDPPKNDEDYDWLRHQAPRAKAALQRQSELAQKLGDNAPDMDAANLHPWRGRTAGPAKSSLVALHRRLLPKRSSTTLGGGSLAPRVPQHQVGPVPREQISHPDSAGRL